MDIKKQYFELVKDGIERNYDRQLEKIEKVAAMFTECMGKGGIVQLFGVRHGEEFVNEMNYRAGGIALFHGLKFKDLVLNELIDQKDVDSGAILDDVSVADKFESFYELDDRDMYCLISAKGNEALLIELAKRAKDKGQRVVGVVNKASYDINDGKLLEYCDEWLDMGADEPDTVLDIDGIKTAQLSSTEANIIAQMLTAEIYRCFIEKGEEAPILLSANIKGADVHNDSLTDPYGRRIR
ncbi:MAG: sugar isomerase domain-containing protein [Erysipelotrichaceae bacterium]|nr:sugar isomerase domain-containing protein [Erysipelotrichaceae bacterium]